MSASRVIDQRPERLAKRRWLVQREEETGDAVLDDGVVPGYATRDNRFPARHCLKDRVWHSFVEGRVNETMALLVDGPQSISRSPAVPDDPLAEPKAISLLLELSSERSVSHQVKLQ